MQYFIECVKEGSEHFIIGTGSISNRFLHVWCFLFCRFFLALVLIVILVRFFHCATFVV